MVSGYWVALVPPVEPDELEPLELLLVELGLPFVLFKVLELVGVCRLLAKLLIVCWTLLDT